MLRNTIYAVPGRWGEAVVGSGNVTYLEIKLKTSEMEQKLYNCFLEIVHKSSESNLCERVFSVKSPVSKLTANIKLQQLFTLGEIFDLGCC